jgi:hypothetical protein
MSSKKHPANRRQPAQPRRKTRPTPTKTVSGIPYWPARDPIGESGGVNLYGFVGNDGVDKYDILGNSASPSELKEGPCCCKVDEKLTTKVSDEQIGKCIKVKAVITRKYLHFSWNPLNAFGEYFTYQKEVEAPGELPFVRTRDHSTTSVSMEYSWKNEGDCPCISKLASAECMNSTITAQHKYTYNNGIISYQRPIPNVAIDEFYILTRSHGYRMTGGFNAGSITSFPITRQTLNLTDKTKALDVFVMVESTQTYHGVFTIKDGANIPPDE